MTAARADDDERSVVRACRTGCPPAAWEGNYAAGRTMAGTAALITDFA
jgi:hypothetical protein